MIGSMLHRVIIKTQSKSSDGRGGTTSTISTVKTIFADVEPLSGRRLQQYGQTFQGNAYLITARWRSVDTVTNVNHKLEWNSRTLIIHSIINKDNRKKYAEIICEEKK